MAEKQQEQGINEWEATERIRENKVYNTQICDMENKIRRLKDKIKNNEKIIFDKCIHDWIYDYSSTRDNTRHFCSKCSLWRNACWYS